MCVSPLRLKPTTRWCLIPQAQNITLACSSRFLFTTLDGFIHSGSFLCTEATQAQGQSFIISRWDYCNARLARPPLRAIKCPAKDAECSCKTCFQTPKVLPHHPINYVTGTCLLVHAYFLKALIKPCSVSYFIRSLALLDLIKYPSRHKEELFSDLSEPLSHED